MLERAFEALDPNVKPFVYALIFVFGFLFGGVPFAYIISKAVAGIDIRKVGSGNVGATNVARVLGLKWGILVFFLDTLKGFLPVFIVRLIVPYNIELALATGLAPILGHIFTPFLGFKGGKGVATSLGVFLAISPIGILLGLIVWIFTVLLTGYVSLGSLLGSLSALLWILFLDPNRSSLPFVVISALVVALIWFRHRENIRRLIKGKEHKIWERKS